MGIISTHFLTVFNIAVAFAAPGFAQQLQRRAAITGGGGLERGRCTVEVVVDGAAEIEIRGNNGTLRNLNGQPPQWRRFECTGPLPNNPGDFRFAGIDGRGSQQLIRDPRSGGVAVVRVEDPQNGAGGYRFEMTWGGPDRNPIETRGPGPGDDRGRRRFTAEEAMNSCQDAVRQQAFQQLNARDITFRRVDPNDNPGPRDSVRGIFEVRRGNGRDETFRFSCSVNFDSGRVFDARIENFGGDRFGGDRGGDRGGRFDPADRAINSCRQAVASRIANDGFDNPVIDSIRVDDRPGRNDRVMGNARANSRRGSAAFSFSCTVNLSDGDVRNVDVQLR
ncbi:MAG TPA: hypothetical protein VG273_09085 [Bryobacteraceae bacterium]|jgi:hypothetical protein|nr:hypothetical protein [Bryobacteraceae bacterium]